MPRSKPISRSVSAAAVPYTRQGVPATPGPHTDDLNRASSAARFPGASPKSALKLPELRRQLFGSHMQLRSQMSQDGQHQQHSQETTPPNPDIAALNMNSSDESQEPTEAASPPRRAGRPRPPDVEDALTQIVQTLQNLQQQQRDMQQQQQAPQAPHQDVPDDPNFDWNRLRLPSTTSFPVPCTGRVQRMAGELLARLPTMAGRDQKEATFVLSMTADWPTLDDEGKAVVYQRLYLYALVAAYGWPTAIAATNAVGGDAVPLPPGITTIVQGPRRGRQQVQQVQRQQQPARPADNPQPPQQRRPRRGRGRGRN